MRRRKVLGLLGGLGITALPTARGQSTGYGPIGRVEIPNTTEVVVSQDGRTAYVAVESGFAVVDVRDPTAPVVVAERQDLLDDHEDGPMAGIIDLKVDGDRLVLPGPGNARRDVVPTGFVLFDVSDPSSPAQLAFHGTRLPIHNAFIEGDRVYLTQGTTVEIVDIGDDEPETVGTIDLVDLDSDWSDVDPRLRSPHDVWVQDQVAYIPAWDAGTLIVDASDPASATSLAHIEGRPLSELVAMSDDEANREAIEPPGNHHYVQASMDGRLLAIGKESWDAMANDGAGGPSGIELWDISVPATPIKLSEINPPRAENETRRGTWTTAHNFDLVGDRLYSSWYRGGVKIHDVSDPGDPTELAWWRLPEQTAFWAAVLATEEFFVASSTARNVGPLTEGLYTFPAEPGEQADPPSMLTPATPSTRLATARPIPSPSSTPSPTAPPNGQPGFGLLAGAASVGAGLWRLHRKRDDGT